MEINKTLAEFVWNYTKDHVFCSRTIIAGKYMSHFGIKRERGRTTTERQKNLQRKISTIFTIMKNLGIATKHSQKCIHINRAVFYTFTLQDVLKYKLSDFHKDKKLKA